MARARVSHGASTYNFAQQLWRPSSLLPPSPMQQHMSSPPPSSSLSRPGNTGSRALSLVWVEQRLPCYLLPDAPSRWHPTAPAPSLLRLAATAARVPCVRQNVEGGVLLQHRRRSPVGRCFAQPPTAPSKPVVRNPRCSRCLFSNVCDVR
jgi:hypothetical protein